MTKAEHLLEALSPKQIDWLGDITIAESIALNKEGINLDEEFEDVIKLLDKAQSKS